MTSGPVPPLPGREDAIPSFLTPALWQHMMDVLELPEQQARVVSLVLQGKRDKQIAQEMGLTRDTVRTYLRRAFDRLGVDDRVGLILRIFAMCLRYTDAPVG